MVSCNCLQVYSFSSYQNFFKLCVHYLWVKLLCGRYGGSVCLLYPTIESSDCSHDPVLLLGRTRRRVHCAVSQRLSTDVRAGTLKRRPRGLAFRGRTVSCPLTIPMCIGQRS